MVGRLQRELDARSRDRARPAAWIVPEAGHIPRDIDWASGLNPGFRFAGRALPDTPSISRAASPPPGHPIDVRVLKRRAAWPFATTPSRVPWWCATETFLDERAPRTWDDYLDFPPFARSTCGRRSVSGGEPGPGPRAGWAPPGRRRQLRELGPARRASGVRGRSPPQHAKYLLIPSPRGALDICNHLARRAAQKPRRTTPTAWPIMAEIGVIDHDLRPRFGCECRGSGTAGPLYAPVDDGEVHGSSRGSRRSRAVPGECGRYLKAQI